MAATNKASFFSGAKTWFYRLMGKPLPVNVTTQTQASVSQPAEEDSVAQDFLKLKAILTKLTNILNSFLTPFAKRGAASMTSTTTAVRTSVDNKFLKNLVRTFLILFFTLVLVFTGIYLFRMLKEEGSITQVPGVSATPPPFEPFRPSVYAQDPEILKIEEDVNILERELNQAKIREDGINPPSLDFDISF